MDHNNLKKGDLVAWSQSWGSYINFGIYRGKGDRTHQMVYLSPNIEHWKKYNQNEKQFWQWPAFVYQRSHNPPYSYRIFKITLDMLPEEYRETYEYAKKEGWI